MLYKSMQVSRNIEKSKNNCREFLAKFIILQLIHMFADLNYTQNTAIHYFESLKNYYKKCIVSKVLEIIKICSLFGPD